MPQDYNATLNLPKTEFPMRAALPKREPGMLEEWNKKDLYHKMIKRNEGKPKFILHDGPPFSNGNIHMGTAMNKVLKDFIVKYHNMTGWYAPYIPGWDNHGMPIESAIIKKNKLDRKKMSIPDFRNACKDFAWDYVNIQRGEFIRLGVLGEWEKPYLTMDPKFEAEEVKIFAHMFEKGYIYKGKKPVYWCPHDETALAEAEIEYADDKCDSIFVKFRALDDKGKFAGLCDLEKTYFVIWTTTTWTLPGNLAICAGPDFVYDLVKCGDETYIMAEELKESVLKTAGIEESEVIAQFKGRELEYMTAQHPFFDRSSIVILGDHVTLESGTGLVHTAPGHGMEDFVVCRKYDDAGLTDIGITVPVDAKGYMTAEAGKFEGLYYDKANAAILEELKERNALLALQTVEHQYPHCWRCKNPIIYRATDQWFCSVEAFRDEAVAACGGVKWLPEWGKDRIVSMITDRADWCISRQRHWGLPIPVFYCSECGKPICTKESISKVCEMFAEHGSNAWYDYEAEQLLPELFKCPHCGGTHFTKETDTLDGWFDSGSSHMAALERMSGYWPADMYLEGADQYRGWFQSSMLTSVAVRGQAPYREVLTHGWVVDGEGKAMHKSLGNAIAPAEVIEKFGADLLRLWVASSDYRVDVRVSDAIFKQLSDIYLKIRNTARYILGNLAGFDPDKDAVPFAEMNELDQWALVRLNKLTERVRKGYDDYEFHVVYHAVHNFCAVDMSNFYLDIIKDRLYCEPNGSLARRSAQMAIYTVLDSLVRMIAPILAFTSDEIWQAMPHDSSADPESVLLNDMHAPRAEFVFPSEKEEKWNALRRLRNDVNKALELARAEKIIGKPLDAEVKLFVTAKEEFAKLEKLPLAELFIVSKVDVVCGEGEGYEAVEFPGVKVKVEVCQAPKCVRCWVHSDTVGKNAEHPELCERCAKAVSE